MCSTRLGSVSAPCTFRGGTCEACAAHTHGTQREIHAQSALAWSHSVLQCGGSYATRLLSLRSLSHSRATAEPGVGPKLHAYRVLRRDSFNRWYSHLTSAEHAHRHKHTSTTCVRVRVHKRTHLRREYCAWPTRSARHDCSCLGLTHVLTDQALCPIDWSQLPPQTLKPHVRRTQRVRVGQALDLLRAVSKATRGRAAVRLATLRLNSSQHAQTRSERSERGHDGHQSGVQRTQVRCHGMHSRSLGSR